jgi:hypothetical protein
MPMTRKFRLAAYKLQLIIFKLTILIVLVFGAVSPVFRHDSVVNYVCLSSVSILAVLAGFSLLRQNPP